MQDKSFDESLELSTSTKYCQICKQYVPWENFYKAPPNKPLRHNLRSYCKSCCNKDNYIRDRDNLKRVARKMVQRARVRARRKGIACTITVAFVMDLIKDNTCSMTGRTFKHTPDVEGEVCPHSPSLDRIDSSKGYIPGNVQAVTMWYNTVKYLSSNKETLEEARNFVNFQDSKGTPTP